MKTINYKKDFKKLYFPPTEPVMVDVPRMNFLMVRGKGSPESKKHSAEFMEGIKALYSIAFTIKFTLKFTKKGPEYSVPPLDGLWWMKGKQDFDLKRPKDWRWQLMIAQPKHITKKHILDAIKLIKERAAKKKEAPSQLLGKVKLLSWKEGKCMQIMHIGPYNKEQPNIEKMHAFAKARGFKIRGRHHEIYLSDPNRTKPNKLKTVLRQPITK